LNTPYWHEIQDHGAQDGVEEFYGKYSTTGDDNVNLKVGLNEFKDNAGMCVGRKFRDVYCFQT